MMDLFEFINKRKSVRKYAPTLLPEETLGSILAFLERLKPLCPDIKTEASLVTAEEVKGLLAIKAPHYLMISSENKPMYLENCGFMYQQVNLFISGLGLGGGWVGLAKPAANRGDGLEFVIVQTLGKPLEAPYRQEHEFARKPLKEIASGSDPRIAHARLAPSAINSQPWFMACHEGNIHMYRQKIGSLKKAFGMEKFNRIDIGIALCHLWLAGEKLNMPFNFEWEQKPPMETPPGYHYVGVVKS